MFTKVAISGGKQGLSSRACSRLLKSSDSFVNTSAVPAANDKSTTTVLWFSLRQQSQQAEEMLPITTLQAIRIQGFGEGHAGSPLMRWRLGWSVLTEIGSAHRAPKYQDGHEDTAHMAGPPRTAAERVPGPSDVMLGHRELRITPPNSYGALG